MKGYIIYTDYEIKNNETIIEIYGRLENNQSFLCLQTIKPYFFIKSSDLEKCSKLLEKFKVEKTNMKDFEGNEVIKISSTTQTDLNLLSKAIHLKKINTYEADIRPHTRYLMDQDILGSLDIEGEYVSSDRLDRIYQNAEIKPSDFTPKLKILSLDIESDKHINNLFCIGLYSEKYKKNLFISKNKIPGAETFEKEADCLEALKKEIIKFDPDIITGWNLIDFDLNYLQKKFKEHKIDFDIGRIPSTLKLRLESNFFRDSSADVKGRQVIDALSFIQDPFIQEAPSIKKARFDSYTLENVSQVILKYMNQIWLF